jgi:hypothetical protein
MGKIPGCPILTHPTLVPITPFVGWFLGAMGTSNAYLWNNKKLFIMGHKQGNRVFLLTRRGSRDGSGVWGQSNIPKNLRVFPSEGRLLDLGIDPEVFRVVLKGFVITQFSKKPKTQLWYMYIYPQSF